MNVAPKRELNYIMGNPQFVGARLIRAEQKSDVKGMRRLPPELRKAHQMNDRAVMEAYGMPVKGTTEAGCVAELMRRYQELTKL